MAKPTSASSAKINREVIATVYKLQAQFRKDLKDPRDRLRITYPLETALVIIILARLAGCKDAVETSDFWKFKLSELQQYLPGLGADIPVPQTIRRLTALIKIDELMGTITEYFAAPILKREELEQSAPGGQPLRQRDVISADGQNLRGTNHVVIDEDGNAVTKNGYDIVSLYSSKHSIAFSQKVVDTKNQEARAIIEMLERVNVGGGILTWDALNTHPSTLTAVLKAKADYVVALKHNAGNVTDHVEGAFSVLDAHPNDREFWKPAITSTRTYKQSGRIYEKTITLLPASAITDATERKKWPGLQSIIRVRTHRTLCRRGEVGKTSIDDRYFISSLKLDYSDKEYSQQMQDVILSRWAVERQHWWLDLTFMQDRRAFHETAYVTNDTLITKFGLNILTHARDIIRPNNPRIALSHLINYCRFSMLTSIRLIAAFATGDAEWILDDDLLRRGKIVKDPVIKDTWVNPYPLGREVDPSTPMGQFIYNSVKGRRRKNRQAASQKK